MYAIKLNQGGRFFGKLKDAQKFQQQIFEDKKIRLDIYQKIENPFTGYAHFEKMPQ